METKMRMIFTNEEISRVTTNSGMITVDLHGLKTNEAKKFLKNIMAINREGYDICAIHGYNHGTAIKEMIRGTLDNPRLSDKKAVKGNYGRTILKMQKVA